MPNPYALPDALTSNYIANNRGFFLKRSDGTYNIPRITRDQLRFYARNFTRHEDTDTGDLVYSLSLAILRDYFGPKWMVKNVFSDGTDGFLKRPLKTNVPTNTINVGTNVVMQRIRDLAEMIFNLHTKTGAEAPLGQVAFGNIESGYAELQFGKFLKLLNISFDYVIPKGVKGHDYDCLIHYPNGLYVCADAKCKLEAGTLSEGGIRSSLDVARKKNLPKGMPSAVFIKIPPRWRSRKEDTDLVETTVKTFLRGTSRIVGVYVFSSDVILRNGRIYDEVSILEILSENAEFESRDGWSLTGRGLQRPPLSVKWKPLSRFVWV